MALSEIEKLERRYAENPQGLTFAPLAEVHRKNGDLTRALELLRPGLELHPDYTPASIVLGRCHLDLGDLPAAEAAFTHVLALDGENVIALKALADINERLHHFDQAERWLHTLLSIDRSNDEARAQLERIEAARQDAVAAPGPPDLVTEAESAPPAAGAAAETGGDQAEAPPAWVAEPEPPAAEEAVPLALEDLEPALLAPDEEIEPPPRGLEVEEPELLEEPVEPIAGLIGRDVDEEDDVVDTGFRVELSEDIILRSSGGREFQAPDAAEELSARMPLVPPSSPFAEERPPAFGGLEEPFAPPPPPPPSWSPPAVEQPTLVDQAALPEPAAPAEPPSPPAPVPEPAAAVAEQVPAEIPQARPEAESPVTQPPVTPEPEPIVTETMAEVLLQQGHSAEALLVYRELEARNGGDLRIRQKIAELEEGGPTAEPAAPRRAYTAAETGGQSVGDFLRTLLAARLPGWTAAPAAARPPVPPPESSGAPTRPAADALSLSSVFGEESSPLPPAVPAAGATPASGVSFDEFYNPPSQGPANQKSRGPDPKNDDLDQFHAWLQNLKR